MRPSRHLCALTWRICCAMIAFCASRRPGNAGRAHPPQHTSDRHITRTTAAYSRRALRTSIGASLNIITDFSRSLAAHLGVLAFHGAPFFLCFHGCGISAVERPMREPLANRVERHRIRCTSAVRWRWERIKRREKINGCARAIPTGQVARAAGEPMLPLWRLLKSKGLWRTTPTPVFARFSTCEKNF